MAQWGKPQTHSADAVIQILAKIPRPHFRLQVASASADKPRYRWRQAQSLSRPAVRTSPGQHLKQPCLPLRAQSRHFFQEDRADAGQTGLTCKLPRLYGGTRNYAERLPSVPGEVVDPTR